MPTGIHTRSPRCQAVVVRDNAAWGDHKPEWRYEVCFAKQLGIGRNGVAEQVSAIPEQPKLFIRYMGAAHAPQYLSDGEIGRRARR